MVAIVCQELDGSREALDDDITTSMTAMTLSDQKNGDIATSQIIQPLSGGLPVTRNDRFTPSAGGGAGGSGGQQEGIKPRASERPQPVDAAPDRIAAPERPAPPASVREQAARFKGMY